MIGMEKLSVITVLAMELLSGIAVIFLVWVLPGQDWDYKMLMKMIDCLRCSWILQEFQSLSFMYIMGQNGGPEL